MDSSHSQFGLLDSIGHHISKSARIVERRVEDGLRQHGLTRIGWRILLAVEEERLRKPSEIANAVGIDRTATSRALRQLEIDGLIAREMGREDRRTTEVSLTDAGRDVLNRATPMCRAALAHLERNLSPTELAELKRLLQRLIKDPPGSRRG